MVTTVLFCWLVSASARRVWGTEKASLLSKSVLPIQRRSSSAHAHNAPAVSKLIARSHRYPLSLHSIASEASQIIQTTVGHSRSFRPFLNPAGRLPHQFTALSVTRNGLLWDEPASGGCWHRKRRGGEAQKEGAPRSHDDGLRPEQRKGANAATMPARDADPVTGPLRGGHPPQQPEYQEAPAKRVVVMERACCPPRFRWTAEYRIRSAARPINSRMAASYRSG